MSTMSTLPLTVHFLPVVISSTVSTATGVKYGYGGHSNQVRSLYYEIKKDVSVRCKECPTYRCYRPDPGIFTQGYRKSVHGDRGYICGTRLSCRPKTTKPAL